MEQEDILMNILCGGLHPSALENYAETRIEDETFVSAKRESDSYIIEVYGDKKQDKLIHIRLTNKPNNEVVTMTGKTASAFLMTCNDIGGPLAMAEYFNGGRDEESFWHQVNTSEPGEVTFT